MPDRPEVASTSTPSTTDTPRDLPAWRHKPSIAVFLLITIASLVADLWLKAWSFAQPDLAAGDTVTLIPSALNLHLTRNGGAVFGIGQGQRAFFVLISVLAIGVIGYMFARSAARAKGYHVALALILAGALGNLYDRLTLGHVRDMLHLLPGVNLPFGWRWPNGSYEVYPWIFNIADVALVFGVGLMVIVMWRSDRKPRTEPATAG